MSLVPYGRGDTVWEFAVDVESLSVEPRWTEHMYAPTSGLDHLGTGSVITGEVLDALSPRVVVVTVHPRYWSFYTWLLWEFWQTDRPKTRQSYSQFHRPREAIFAVGAAGGLCRRPEHETLAGAVIGSSTAGPHAESVEVYDATIEYLQHRTGGYGAQYAGTIARTGLTYLAEPAAGLPWDAPTDAGAAVAEAYRTAVADTTYLGEYFPDDEAQVPRDVVTEYIECACLCQLRTDTAPERDLLHESFLHGGDPREAQAQRATFRFILDIADQTPGFGLDQDQFRQLTYFRATDIGASIQPRAITVDTARRWRMYQAREYYNFALNRMWQWVVTHGLNVTNDGLTSLPQAALLDDAVTALNTSHLADRFDVEPPRLDADSTLDSWEAWLADRAAVDTGDLDRAWDVDASVQEHTLFRYADGLDRDDARCLPACFAILVLIGARFGDPETEMRYRYDWSLMRAGGIYRLAMSRFLSRWRTHLRARDPAGAVLSWLLDDYVIRQHLRVATTKLPTNYTFRFVLEGDRLRFNDLPTRAGMNNSRFTSLATVLHELGFVGPLASERHELTTSGQHLLEHGELPRPTGR